MEKKINNKDEQSRWYFNIVSSFHVTLEFQDTVTRDNRPYNSPPQKSPTLGILPHRKFRFCSQ